MARAEKKRGVIKVTTSGQVTLPKAYREKYNTDVFVYEIEGSTFVVHPLQIRTQTGGKQFTSKDAAQFVFSSRNKREKNLGDQIDKILYGAD